MFKPADLTRRTPAWLQSHTKENITFQFTLAAVLVAGIYAKDKYEERKLRKNLENQK